MSPYLYLLIAASVISKLLFIIVFAVDILYAVKMIEVIDNAALPVMNIVILFLNFVMLILDYETYYANRQ